MQQFGTLCNTIKVVNLLGGLKDGSKMNKFFNGFRQLPPGIQYTLILSILLVVVLLIAFPGAIAPLAGLLVTVGALFSNKGGGSKV